MSNKRAHREESTDQELQPDPWWVDPVEKLLTFVLIVVGGLPAMLLTENVYAAAVSGIAVAALFNIGWWKLYKGESIREVYGI